MLFFKRSLVLVLSLVHEPNDDDDEWRAVAAGCVYFYPLGNNTKDEKRKVTKGNVVCVHFLMCGFFFSFFFFLLYNFLSFAFDLIQIWLSKKEEE